MGGSELPTRRHPGMKGYDYSAEGAYFLTLCAKAKRCLFSSVGRGILDAPPPQLTKYGIQIESAIRYLDGHAVGVTIDKYVIMPNHVHLIVLLDAAALGASGKPRPTNATNAVIPKLVSSLKRYTNRSCGAELWQDTYHDHVIRNETDYLRVWSYIDQNPVRWAEDCYYMEGETPPCTQSRLPS